MAGSLKLVDRKLGFVVSMSLIILWRGSRNTKVGRNGTFLKNPSFISQKRCVRHSKKTLRLVGRLSLRHSQNLPENI